ncbi:MAG: hypothetical protein QM754_15750 [Tepidisphaeraceae bacterium]
MTRRRTLSIVEAILALLVIVGLALGGIALRKKVWYATEFLRFDGDMQNGWNWGSRAAKDGYFGLYDDVVAHSINNAYFLDYLPLRLAAMTVWAKTELARLPDVKTWQPDFEFNRPVMRFNTVCEGMTALGVLLLAWDWLRRDRQASLNPPRRPMSGVWLAILAGAIAWFSPASLVSSHGRPTWDVWVTPFYVWAVFLAGRNLWLTAGCVVGVGALFKGQQLFGAPLFLLWPLMRFRFGAAGRFVIGFAVAVALVTSPWMVGTSFSAIAFVVAVAWLPVGVWLLLTGFPIAGRRMPAGWLRWLVPSMAALAIWLCVPLFGGSINWLRVGLIYGAEKFDSLEVGRTISFAGVLQTDYRWQSKDLVPALQNIWPGLTISHLLMGLFAVCLLLAAWSAGRYEKRGDKRFLLAIALPWIAYFAFFPRMHERYLLWGATLACMAIVVNLGSFWLGLFFMLCSTSMSLMQMAESKMLVAFATRTPPLDLTRDIYEWLKPTYPGAGWAVTTATVAWLWITIAGAAGRRKQCTPISSKTNATAEAVDSLPAEPRPHEPSVASASASRSPCLPTPLPA